MKALRNESQWRMIERIARWIIEARGHGAHERCMRILKIGEELGELAEAKPSEEINEACDVAITALVALSADWVEDYPLAAEVFNAAEAYPLPPTVAGAFGDVAADYIGHVGQNPRKGFHSSAADVAESLACCARAALRIVEQGSDPERALSNRLVYLCKRLNLPVEG